MLFHSMTLSIDTSELSATTHTIHRDYTAVTTQWNDGQREFDGDGNRLWGNNITDTRLSYGAGKLARACVPKRMRNSVWCVPTRSVSFTASAFARVALRSGQVRVLPRHDPHRRQGGPFATRVRGGALPGGFRRSRAEQHARRSFRTTSIIRRNTQTIRATFFFARPHRVSTPTPTPPGRTPTRTRCPNRA